jgi:hypothetical protein
MSLLRELWSQKADLMGLGISVGTLIYSYFKPTPITSVAVSQQSFLGVNSVQPMIYIGLGTVAIVGILVFGGIRLYKIFYKKKNRRR